MHINIPSFTDPSRTEKMENAYGWIASESVDASNGTGRIVLYVYPGVSEANAGLPPVKKVSIVLGQNLVMEDKENNVNEVNFPTLAEFLSNPDFAQAFGLILSKLYEHALDHPDLKGSTIVQED